LRLFRTKKRQDLGASYIYLREKRGRPDELLRFARACRVEKVMRPYIETLL